MARHWQSHEVAYAAMEQADETAAQFDRYLIEQRAYTQALQQYTEQLQEQQMAPQQNQSFLIENDAQGNTWCCASQDREVCWNNNLWYRCSAQ
jgi:Neuraminidase (sialidase)